ncbi:MAG: hypothetical protein PHO02_03725 [Candidatus Nanoarchaeia archaeon]|nr:hypothetical protein [Candidatus Nanoarchaeia archaeon]
MEPSQRNALYRGAVERYAHAPPEKPRIRFPWGLLIGLLILIIVYYFVNKMLF